MIAQRNISTDLGICIYIYSAYLHGRWWSSADLWIRTNEIHSAFLRSQNCLGPLCLDIICHFIMCFNYKHQHSAPNTMSKIHIRALFILLSFFYFFFSLLYIYNDAMNVWRPPVPSAAAPTIHAPCGQRKSNPRAIKHIYLRVNLFISCRII